VRLRVLLGAAIAACSSSSTGGAPDVAVDGSAPAEDAAREAAAPTDAGADQSASGDAALRDAASEARSDAALGAPNVRVMAANLTSGSNQSYDPGEGLRIFEGLKPDVVLIQEFNYGADGDADMRAMVDKAFGATFSYYREPAQLPNGIISRFPIAASGTWTDPAVSNRGFVWAKITGPGSRPLWAVSLHLLTTSAANRDKEAAALVAQIKSAVPDGDYLVVGGDLNTETRGEACMATLGQMVTTTSPYPDDGTGNDNTSGTRTKPHDWVLADPDLAPRQVATVIGTHRFPNGLVFDSRVYTPLAEVAPVLASDCAATNMQHMAVVKDFNLP
jgi:endonuclease/exonuclease/phosphatase family metal-dependent hydrolase